MFSQRELQFLAGNNKKYNKKKKKQQHQQQQPAFLVKSPRPQVLQQVRNMNPRTVNQTVQHPTPQVFQAPHHQPESMVELSDDTSPNTPLASTSGGWKPLASTNKTPEKSSPAEIKITPTRQEKWLKFRDSLVIKTPAQINKMGKRSPPPEKREEDQKKEEEETQDDEKDITWELNALDDEKRPEKPKMYDCTPAKPEVVQGKASDIKLFQLNPSGKVKYGVDQIRNQTTQHNNPTLNLPIASYPKGVPRSFLLQQQTIGAIQPQENQNLERNQPIPTRFQEGPAGQMPPDQTSSGFYQGIMTEFDQAPSEIMTGFDQMPVSTSTFNEELGYMSPPTTFYQGSEYAQSRFEQGPESQMHTGFYEEGIEEAQQYSPTEADDDGSKIDHEGSASPVRQGQKRLSAFHRLGPLTQPKKPKLTINLLCNKDVREVLDTEQDDEDKYTPVHLRKDILDSCDETVMKFLPSWPWRRNVPVRKSVTFRNSKTAMIMELEQMEEIYEKDNAFIQVSVKGYPRSWRKEDVLDVVLEHVSGKSFIPCFIEFSADECKFFVIRSRSALVTIHKLGFYLRKDNVELAVTICYPECITLKQLEFIPRLVLRKLLALGYDEERKLNLREFTLKPDISHFIYFPLNRLTNQAELIQLQSTVAWDFLTDLDLSHNRITWLDGFELSRTTPKLKHLDLSHNCLDRVTLLLRDRTLSLRSIKLEGNPLCHNYTDPAQYVKVLKMIFPSLTEIDGVPIDLKGDLPRSRRNFCPPDAEQVATKFLEVFFPLLEAPCNERRRIEAMYDNNAVLTVTYRNVLRCSSLHRKFRNIFLRARDFAEGDTDKVEGASPIARLLYKWPDMTHDTNTFTVDVIFHTENTTILRVGGILKLISETLAEDEHLVAFTRTVVLNTVNGTEYKIMNEMVYWDEPCEEMANVAFQINTIRTSKPLSLKLDSPPDEDLKTKLIEIFARITELDKKSSERCLIKKEWNLKDAIEYFMKFLKLDDLECLKKELQNVE